MATEPAGGRLTTHVLDTARGRPARGVRIDLFAVREGAWEVLGRFATNADGRCDAPLLAGERFRPGVYQLEFHIGAYFDAAGVDVPAPRFLDVVPVRFGIASAAEHYHVPLLISPFGYSTYRGS